MASFIPKNLITLVGSVGGLYGICQVKSNHVKAEENFVKSKETSKLENNYKPTSLFQIEEINSVNDKSARKIQEEKLQKIITGKSLSEALTLTCQANLNILGEKKHLHNLIRTYTLINF